MTPLSLAKDYAETRPLKWAEPRDWDWILEEVKLAFIAGCQAKDFINAETEREDGKESSSEEASEEAC